MQLILDTEPTIDIKRNMSTLNEETLVEKLDDVIEDLKSGLCNGNKENIQCQENVISSVEEPHSHNEKIEEVIAAKSPISEQSVDTILKSPDLDESTETTVKSPNPDAVTEMATNSPKPDDSTVIGDVILDDKHSISENIASDETEDEKLDMDIKGVEETKSISTEDISLRMEEDSPSVVDDQTNNDEESDPIILSHDIISCSNGQEEEIIEKNDEVTEKTDKINEEINKKDKLNKNADVDCVEIVDKLPERVDEKMEVADKIENMGVVDKVENMEVVDKDIKEPANIEEMDTTCLNGLNEDGDKKEVNDESINEIENEKLAEVVDGTCLNGEDQEVPKKVDADDIKMQEEIAENDTESTSIHENVKSTEVNGEHTPNSCDTKTPNEKDVPEKSCSEIDTNTIKKLADAPKEIETVDLDDEEKETEKSLKIEDSDGQLNVQNPIENGSVSDKIKNPVAEMETVDLIDEKDSNVLESMEVDNVFNSEAGEPEEKPISLSSEKDDIFDCDENFEEMVPTEETLTDKAENNELKINVTPMDEDIQPVDNKINHTSLDTKKEDTINIPDDEVKEQESKGEELAKEISPTSSQPSIATDELKNIPSVLKLSNTLNILSDDEDETIEPLKTDTPAQNTELESAAENKCINIEDDDDIMLIDEEDNSKENKSEPTKPEAQSLDIEPKEDAQSEKKVDVEASENLTENAEKTTESQSESLIDKEKPEGEKDENISEVKTEPIKPLVPTNFLKTCKKNMAEMTRDDLEEFCILKIVESVVDRSSLSEIKSKLKSMAHGIEEYKKKAQMLQKQNRDLQVVLKTIQEEQKNAKTVTPLKITRSVGMQVLMTERSTIRRKPPGPGVNSNNTTPTKTPSPRTPNQRPIKVPATPSPQQIPVPRLVPASNSPAAKNNMPQINATTSKAASPINGVRNNVQKAEKRSINRNHSVTVDLTDDEPPTKIMNRNSAPTPLRVVPPHMVPQNLLAATPRHPIAQNNNPRKVYIPISGPQSQNIRAGQAIMLKSVGPNQTPRPRGPQPHMTRMPQNQVRMPRVQNRHPAPLPESTKQYPGTYLKALPPAPDLKLSKVENGIVISWKIEGYQEDSYEEIASYQLYAYQETNSPPSTALWKKIGDVKALPLPMACTLTQFMAGFKYYFAVRAVDIRSRIGPFSLPGSILLLNKL